jgi:hypothetical protein
MMKRNKHHYKGMICKELVLLGCMDVDEILSK